MHTSDFTMTLSVEQSPAEVFRAVNNVRGWWSETIEGDSEQESDAFTYRHKDMHWSVQKLGEVIENKKVSWLVTDSQLHFLQKKDAWNDTTITFEIVPNGAKTDLHFTHWGLNPGCECFDACSQGWNYYLLKSLYPLITTGQGNPDRKIQTTQEVALRFHALAQDEKWFEIQDELFAEHIRSIEPAHAVHLAYAEGKAAVRQKGENWVSRILAFHGGHTTAPVVGGNFFAVGRHASIDVEGIGRLDTNEMMLYEVREGKIVTEQFFY